jgi:hypothetical protein
MLEREMPDIDHKEYPRKWYEHLCADFLSNKQRHFFRVPKPHLFLGEVLCPHEYPYETKPINHLPSRNPD